MPYDVEVDAWMRYVDGLAGPDVPAYLTLDMKLAWCPTDQVEVAIVGRNLLDPAHLEYGETYLNTAVTEVVRSVYAKLTWLF